MFYKDWRVENSTDTYSVYHPSPSSAYIGGVHQSNTTIVDLIYNENDKGNNSRVAYRYLSALSAVLQGIPGPGLTPSELNGCIVREMDVALFERRRVFPLLTFKKYRVYHKHVFKKLIRGIPEKNVKI